MYGKRFTVISIINYKIFYVFMYGKSILLHIFYLEQWLVHLFIFLNKQHLALICGGNCILDILFPAVSLYMTKRTVVTINSDNNLQTLTHLSNRAERVAVNYF